MKYLLVALVLLATSKASAQETGGDLYLECTADVCQTLFSTNDRDYPVCVAAQHAHCLETLSEYVRLASERVIDPVCTPKGMTLAVLFVRAVGQHPERMGRSAAGAVHAAFHRLWPCTLGGAR